MLNVLYIYKKVKFFVLQVVVITSLRPGWAKVVRLYLKNNKQTKTKQNKKGWGHSSSSGLLA
jgi:hypothetical protein